MPIGVPGTVLELNGNPHGIKSMILTYVEVVVMCGSVGNGLLTGHLKGKYAKAHDWSPQWWKKCSDQAN